MQITLSIALIALTGCQEQILHGLEEQNANILLSKLKQVNIEADKIHQPDGKWALAVANPHVSQAIAYLADRRALNHQARVQTQERSALIPSREDQKYQYQLALSSAIEDTLESLNGVLEARVHLNLPLSDSIFGQRNADVPSSASVLLIVEDKFNSKIEEVASLVGGASGVNKEQISVLVHQGGSLDVTTTQLSTVNRYGVSKPAALQIAIGLLLVGVMLLLTLRKLNEKGRRQ